MVEKLNGMPEVYAEITGSGEYPQIHGMVSFYEVYDGAIVMAEIYGLPEQNTSGGGSFFGFHIHEGEQCTGTRKEAFADTGGHLNRTNEEHPYHTGDLPPLLSVNGSAWMAVYTGRFHPEDIVGNTVVIHLEADDFRTQPSGMSGIKIACGEIKEGLPFQA